MILSNGTHSVTLPDELEWKEELSWTFKVVKEERGVTGKLIRTVSTRVGGMPCTLQAPSGDLGNVPRSTVKTLKSMAVADEVMTLAFSQSETLQMTFRHEPAALDPSPALGFTRRKDAERWRIVIRLSTVATS